MKLEQNPKQIPQKSTKSKQMRERETYVPALSRLRETERDEYESEETERTKPRVKKPREQNRD